MKLLNIIIVRNNNINMLIVQYPMQFSGPPKAVRTCSVEW